MSTTAIIFCKNVDGNFDGITVQYDGYVDGGVGEQLAQYWTNTEDIQKLCGMTREIRSFGKSFEDLDIFDDYNDSINSKIIYELKGLTFEQMINKCGNYDYAYFWDVQDLKGNFEWMLWKSDYTFIRVNAILEVAHPCH